MQYKTGKRYNIHRKKHALIQAMSEIIPASQCKHQWVRTEGQSSKV